MDWVSNLKESNSLDLAMGSSEAVHGSNSWKPKEGSEKKAAVCAEMERLNQLPANAGKGNYATQRMRVLNKILQLMSIQRTKTQDEELELLFAGLSL